MKPSESKAAVSPFPRGLLVTASLVVILWGMAAAREFLIPLLLSALLAFLMRPMVARMRLWRFPEWLAITVSALVLLLPVFFGMLLLVQQVQALVTDFPKLVDSLQKTLVGFSQSEWGQRLHLGGEFADISALTHKLGASAGQGLEFALMGVRTVFDASMQSILIGLFAIVMVASRRELKVSAKKLLADFKSIESASVLEEVTTLIERFLVARLLIVLICGAASIAVLMAFRVSYGFLLGVLVGVSTLIPAIGIPLSFVPVAIVALATGFTLGTTAVVIALLVAIGFVEGNILTPKLVGQKVNLNALATLVGFFAGGLMWGVWGMLLSIPILGVLRVAFLTSPSLSAWGELLSEQKDAGLIQRRLARRKTSKRTSPT